MMTSTRQVMERVERGLRKREEVEEGEEEDGEVLEESSTLVWFCFFESRLGWLSGEWSPFLPPRMDDVLDG